MVFYVKCDLLGCLAMTVKGLLTWTLQAILSIVKKPITLKQYNVTKIHGGSGGPGNDALASIVLHIQVRAVFHFGPRLVGRSLPLPTSRPH